MSRKIVMLGSAPRTQRSQSAFQLPTGQEGSSNNAPIFSYSTSDFIYDLRTLIAATDGKEKLNTLGNLLMSQWEEAKKAKVFNYDLNCMYKLLPGEFGFSLQLNVERGELRRKPMRFRRVREPFNKLRWNFTKLNTDEVLLYLHSKDRFASRDPLDQHMIAINAAPLERGHSLLLPCINRCCSQNLSEMAVRLATDVMLLVHDESFHVLYNSLLGLASVNHMHLHLLFWPYDSDLINRKSEHVYENMYVIKRPIWFVHTFVFQLQTSEQYERFVTNIARCVEYFVDREIAHNVYFSRAQPLRTNGDNCVEDRCKKLPLFVTAYIFPRSSVVGAKPAVHFSPAALELSGCLTARTWKFFESVTEDSVLRIMDEEATLSDAQYNQIHSDLTDVLSGKKLPTESTYLDSEMALSSPELDELRDSFQAFEVHSPRRILSSDQKDFAFNIDDIHKPPTDLDRKPPSSA